MPYLTSSDNLLPDSPIVRDRIVKRYHAKSRQPFDLLSEIGRDSVGAVTLIPEDETVTHPIMAWEKLTEARLEEVLTAYKADIPLGMIREENDFRIPGCWRTGEDSTAQNRQ